MRAGKYLDGEKITFHAFQQIWEKDWAAQRLTQRVQEDYKATLKHRAEPAIGNMKIAKIRPSHIQSIITTMVNEGLSPKTVRHTFVAINSVMKYAYKMEVIETNPCDRCELPKMDTDTSLHYFTLEQAKTFLAALDREYTTTHRGHTRTLAKTGEQYTVPEYTETHTVPLQLKAFFTLAVYGGFRRGELLALTWNDVDFESNTISINKAVSETKQGVIVKDTKTKAGNREIVLPTVCFTVLRRWRAEELELSMKLGSKWQGSRGKDFDDNRVFIQPGSGLPMDPSTPYQRFKSIIKDYNATCEKDEDKLPNIRLHDLRHTSATLLLSEGVDIETVSHRLGHSRASITLDVYGHALETKDSKASETLGNLFAANG